MASRTRRVYRFGPFRFDVAERMLFRDDAKVALAPKSLDLLLALIEAVGRLQTREELTATLWPKTIVGDHNLTVYLCALRKSLGDEGETPRYIQTVRRHGYRFIAPVALEEAPPSAAHRWPPVGAMLRYPLRAGLGTAAVLLLVAAALLAYFHLRAPADSGSGVAIAVLPFANQSGNRTDEYLVAGIRDTILTKLAAVRELRVISGASAKRWPNQSPDLQSVGRQLSAATLLEGSVQKLGDRALINVRLVSVRTGEHVWAQTYTVTLNDILSVEQDVAARVAAALTAKLLPAESARLSYSPTRDPQAYLLFLQANYYADQVFRRGTNDPVHSLTRATTLYREALAHDPEFALARVQLSLVESYACWYSLDPSNRSIENAERAAKRALALDSTLPEAQLAMGYVAYYGHRNYASALAHFRQARRRLPNDADVIGAIALVYRRQGDWRNALAGFREAAAQDLRNPRWPEEIAISFVALRRYSQALQEFDRALAIDPGNRDVTLRKARAVIVAGEPGRSGQILRGVSRAVDPQGVIAGISFEVSRLAHRPDRALAALAAAPPWMIGPSLTGKIPRSLLEAEARSMLHDEVRSKQAYRDAAAKLQAALRGQPDNPDLRSALGLAEAGLGQRETAIRDGRRASELFPLSRDPLAGSAYLAALAKIYARAGQPEPAVNLLERLLAMPAGAVVSVPLLKLDPAWDPVRGDPRFAALLKRYGNGIPSGSNAKSQVPAPD